MRTIALILILFIIIIINTILSTHRITENVLSKRYNAVITQKDEEIAILHNYIKEILEFYPDVQNSVCMYYNACKAQCDDSPTITASGFHIILGSELSQRICAMSYSLAKKNNLHFHDSIVIISGVPAELSGIWIFEDLKNDKAPVGIDLLLPKWYHLSPLTFTGQVKWFRLKN